MRQLLLKSRHPNPAITMIGVAECNTYGVSGTYSGAVQCQPINLNEAPETVALFCRTASTPLNI